VVLGLKLIRDYWRHLSQSGTPGRPGISKDVRDLIRDMWRSNPLWGAPRIVGELRKLGITVAKSTVEKYRPRVHKPSSPTWKTFLNNHVEDLIACDFFTVPTATFRVLFVFIMLAHERRRIVHFNITEHPTAQWTAQQIVEAFPWETAPRYLLRDRDAIYSRTFQRRVQNIGIEEVKIAPCSPWQNPYCERLIGSIRREVLDHVIVLNDRHLRRVLTTYISHSAPPLDDDPPIFPGAFCARTAESNRGMLSSQARRTSNACTPGEWYGSRATAYRSVPRPTSAHCESLC
jgi:transposase InsO family protein